MTQQASDLITQHYLRIVRDTAEGVAKTVCRANKIPHPPKFASELKPIPVFEEDAAESLLTLASKRAETILYWPTAPTTFLQAYWKRYRKENNRIRQEVIVMASNYCWARFYAAKELMHCLIEEDGLPASNSLELVNDLLGSLAAGGYFFNADCRPQTIVDQIAWLGATEYLVPEPWLPVIHQAQQQLTAQFPGENSCLYLAQVLRVPELVLKIRLRQHHHSQDTASA